MKYEHEVIRDLMPLCIDGIASPQSQRAVETHIAECPDCAKEWDSMKNEIQTYDNTPLPEDTQKFVKTAKRIRKHNRWVLLKVTCGVIAAMLMVLCIGNYIGGARFTARSSAEHFIRSSVMGDIFATPEEYHNAGKPKLTYLGKTVNKKSETSVVYELLETKDGSVRALCACYVSRSPDLAGLGMWRGSAFGTSAVPDESSPSLVLDIANDGSDYHAVIYSTDERVSTVEIVAEGNTVAIALDNKGFGAEPLNIYQDWTAPPGEDHRVREGRAMDASGKVLYALEPVEEGDRIAYKWVSAE